MVCRKTTKEIETCYISLGYLLCTSLPFIQICASNNGTKD